MAGDSSSLNFDLLVDSYPPVCTGISLWEFPPGQRAFIGHRPQLNASWTCTDRNGSGIFVSEWAVGTAPGLDDALPWTVSPWAARNASLLPLRFVSTPAEDHVWSDHSLIAGVRYFVNARVQDGANWITTTSSAVFMMDSTPPMVSSPVILVHNQSHARFPGRLARHWPHPSVLIAQFQFDDLESGVQALRVGVTETADEPDWNDARLHSVEPSATRASSSLTSRQTTPLRFAQACAMNRLVFRMLSAV